MLSASLLSSVALALLTSARAAPTESALAHRQASNCDGETAARFCYYAPDNTPQNVNYSDVTYIAAYLRAYGAQTRAGRLFTMSIADAPDCAEWELYSHGSALATAKHINSNLNSSVLFADIANTIDGGAGATVQQQANSILGCGTAGGSEGTQYNASNPAYHASTYPAGYTPDGILIKIVSSTPQ